MLSSAPRTSSISNGPSPSSSSLLPTVNPRKRSRSPSSANSPTASRRTGSPFINNIPSSPPRAASALPVQVEPTLSLPSVFVSSPIKSSSPPSLSAPPTSQEATGSSTCPTETPRVKEEIQEASLEVEKGGGDAGFASSSQASHSSRTEALKGDEKAVEKSSRAERETSTRPSSPMTGVVSSESSMGAGECERCRNQSLPCIRPSTKPLDPSRPVVSATPLASSRTDTPPPPFPNPSTPNPLTSTRCNGCISANQDCVFDGVVAARSSSNAPASSRPLASFAHRLPSPPATSTDVSGRPHLDGTSESSAEERWVQEKRSLTDRVGWLEGEVARLSQGQERLLKTLEAGEKKKSKKMKVSPLGGSSDGHVALLPNGTSTARPVAPPGELLGKHHLPSLGRPSSSSSSSSSINGSAPSSRRPSLPQPSTSASLTFTLPPSTTPLPSALAALPPAPFRRPVSTHHRPLSAPKDDAYGRSRQTQSPHTYALPPPLEDQPRRASEHERPSVIQPRRNSPPDLQPPQHHLQQPPPLRNPPASWFPGASSPFGAGASASSSSSSRFPPPGSWSSAPPPPLNRGGPPDGNWNPPPAFSRAPFGGNDQRRGSGDVGYSTSSVATPPSHLNNLSSSRGAPALPPGFLTSTSRTSVSSPALSPKHSSPPPPVTNIVPPSTSSSSSSSRSPLPLSSSHSIASLLSAAGTSSALDRRRKSFTGIGAGFQESSVRGVGKENVEDEDEDATMESESPPRGGAGMAGKEMRV
ncbi:hypothetical protein BDY24DRAFT_419304 [Mrakia frigida]|uniref:uncharacterized protein n=1 Tax=Mrakia frigida TaxID=29902 RepID=UPI003FCC0892